MNHSDTATPLESAKASIEMRPGRRYEDTASRKRFIGIAILVGTVSHVAFSLTNLYRGIFLEAILNAVMGSLLFVGFLINRRVKSDSRAVVVILLGVTTTSITAAFLFEQNASHAVALGFYILTPLALFALGSKHGIRFSIPVLILAAAIVLAPQIVGRTSFPSQFPQRFLGSLVIVTILAWILERVRAHSWELLFRAKEKLKEATRTLDTLEGLIPICSYCKKIRKDERYWQKLETYLTKHTSAQISSGYCPKCSNEQVPHDGTRNEPFPAAVSEILLNSDVWEKMKRWTSIGFLFAGVLVLWGISAYEIVGGLPDNAFLYLAVSVPYIACVSLQKKNQLRRTADNVFIGSIVVMVFQQVINVEQNTFALLWLFVIPVTANFLAGLRTGTLWSGITLALLIVLFNSPFSEPAEILNPEFKIKFTAFFIILSLLAYVMERTQECYQTAVMSRLEALKQTYLSIRTLKGLVPVCASCKSIRDDAGFWTSLEEYLIENTNLKLSHGICPRCLKEHHPDIYQEMRAQSLVVKAEEMRTSSFASRPYLSSLPPSSLCEDDE